MKLRYTLGVREKSGSILQCVNEQVPYGLILFEMTHFTHVCNWFLYAEPVEVYGNGMII